MNEESTANDIEHDESSRSTLETDYEILLNKLFKRFLNIFCQSIC